jgi:hypothetical protein
MAKVFPPPEKKSKAPGAELKKTEKKLERQRFNPFAALLFKPQKVQFETQEKKEEIILLMRRHWLTNVPWIIGSILMVFLPLLFREFPPFLALPSRFQSMTVFLWYLLIFGFILENFLTWAYNVYIVTDERVVDIDFYSPVYKEISHCKIDRIEDVTYRMGGVTKTLFNFGDVLIQTAAERPVFEFRDVAHPALVVKKINDLIIEEEQEKIEGRIR